MKVAMDADCLIKLTKAGLKERVCDAWQISIPQAVQRETVEQSPLLPDAVRIRTNLEAGRLDVAADKHRRKWKGEDAVLRLYQDGSFDAVATDDTRFIRQLRGLGVPYAVPAVILIKLWQSDIIADDQALWCLASLRPHISADEHAVAHLILTGGPGRDND